MTNKKSSEEPDLFKELKQKTINRLISWFMRQKIGTKVFISLIGMIILLFLGYLGVFGERNEKILKNLVRYMDWSKNDTIEFNNHIEEQWNVLFDTIKQKEDSARNAAKPIGYIQNSSARKVNAASLLPLTMSLQQKPRIIPQLTFTINGNPGKNKGLYQSGDELTLFLNLNKPSYLLFVSIDSKGMYYPLEDYSEYYESSVDLKIANFILNDTEGIEAYYVLASYHQIDSREIDSTIRAKQNIIKDIRFKGSEDYFRLKLPEGIYQDNIFFYNNYHGD